MLDILSSRIALIRDSLGNRLTDIVAVSVEFNSFKLRVLLIDGSTLRVEEHYAENRLGRYAYYLLDRTNNLIIGWDNAPHHTRLPNFPHHKHIARQDLPEPSYEATLESVLAVIKQQSSASS